MGMGTKWLPPCPSSHSDFSNHPASLFQGSDQTHDQSPRLSRRFPWVQTVVRSHGILRRVNPTSGPLGDLELSEGGPACCQKALQTVQVKNSMASPTRFSSLSKTTQHRNGLPVVGNSSFGLSIMGLSLEGIPGSCS